MAGVEIARRPPAKPLISLVPMIDVMLILLVFFMVTSTYLDLDMIPVIERGEGTERATTDAGGAVPGGSVLIRIGADGQPAISGQTVDLAGLTTAIQTRLREDPKAQILILPSNAAPLQGLVTVLDTATIAGATRLRVLRLEVVE
ncbi:MAG: biopolymer transporter ExbD [Pseudomonadota bacterium]